MQTQESLSGIEMHVFLNTWFLENWNQLSIPNPSDYCVHAENSKKKKCTSNVTQACFVWDSPNNTDKKQHTLQYSTMISLCTNPNLSCQTLHSQSKGQMNTDKMTEADDHKMMGVPEGPVQMLLDICRRNTIKSVCTSTGQTVCDAWLSGKL